MPWLISYDIEDDKQRLNISKRLLADGCIRVQKSVFAGQMSDTVFKNLLKWLQELPRGPDDSVFILDIGPETLQNARWIGKEAPDWQFATDPPDVLFI